jgi:hypothetical protein
VPIQALQKLFVQPASSQKNGYSELQTEILSLPQIDVIPELEHFIFSLNTKYVSDIIRDAKGFVLFVEYGKVTSFTPVAEKGVIEIHSIFVIHEISIANNDSINETLLMNQAYNILIQILNTMYRDQKNPEYCPANSLIDFPAEIHPVDPPKFFDHGGWAAIFERSNTIS